MAGSTAFHKSYVRLPASFETLARRQTPYFHIKRAITSPVMVWRIVRLNKIRKDLILGYVRELERAEVLRGSGDKTQAKDRLKPGLVRTVRLKIIGRCIAGDDVFFFRPGAKINLLAALRTKRTPAIGFFPFHLVSAGRAINNSNHVSDLLKITKG